MKYPQTARLIRKARHDKGGLTQESAAQQIGCSRLQFIRWEQGIHRPGDIHAPRLCEVLGIKPEELAAADEEEDDLAAHLSRMLREFVRREVRKVAA